MYWHQGCIPTTHLAMNSLVILLKSEGKLSILFDA